MTLLTLAQVLSERKGVLARSYNTIKPDYSELAEAAVCACGSSLELERLATCLVLKDLPRLSLWDNGSEVVLKYY